MNKSEQINELAAALNKAQSEMTGAKKKSANPFFKSKYADLSAVIEAISKPFAENGLSFSQFPINQDGQVGVETILMHESGQWMSQAITFPLMKQDPQAVGSTLTYARRYSLQSVCGVPSEDDDCEAGMARGQQQNYQQQQQKQEPEKPWFNEDNYAESEDWIAQQKKAGVSAQDCVKMIRQKYAVSRDMANSIELFWNQA